MLSVPGAALGVEDLRDLLCELLTRQLDPVDVALDLQLLGDTDQALVLELLQVLRYALEDSVVGWRRPSNFLASAKSPIGRALERPP